MLAVLSPAKALDFSAPDAKLELTTTQPELMQDATSLMRTARGLSQTKIRTLMSISPDLAKLNYERYRSFELPFSEANALSAALAFNGEVYRGLGARSLSREDLGWAQDRVAILSGLFGLLRPLDLIQPYRLEMGTSLKTRRGDNLYKFWGDKISKRIDALTSEHQDPTLVNLASNEYFKAVDQKALKTNVITCIFEDYKTDPNEGKVISFLAKQARGMMARYIIEERIEARAGLKDFRGGRYQLDAARSSDERLIFKRKFIAVADQ